jgi:hypothetical protein
MNIVAALRTPRVALWKCRPMESVENSQNEFPPPFHRAWKSSKRPPDSHISTAPAAGLSYEGGEKMKRKPNSS